MDSLVSTEWLARELGSGDIRIVDASYHLGSAGRDAAADYAAGHIPGAVFLSLGTLVDAASPVENTVPPADFFAARVGDLGIGANDRIVLYDDSAIRSAARAWYLFHLFGARKVAILDGGLGKWNAEGRPLASGVEHVTPRHFAALPAPGRLRSKADVLDNIASKAEQLVDARGAARFTGEEADPRPGIDLGHIPGACNVSFGLLYNPDGTFKDKAGLEAAFASAGIDLARPIITSCGSGVTACVLAFALHQLGKNDVALYDGSWTEWGGDPATPKALG